MIENIKAILKSKVVQNGIWLTILQVVNTVIPMLTIPYITRILGANEYGVFSIALNWITYLQVLVEFGFGLSGARKVSITNNERDIQNLYNNIITARLLLTMLSIAIMLIIILLSQFEKTIIMCMVILFTMIIGTTLQLTWLFQGKEDMKFITIINTVSRIISVMLIFLFVKSKNDLLLYCFLYSITLLLSSIISWIVANKKYNLRFKLSTVKDAIAEIKEAKYLFISAAMTKIFGGFGTTILGIFSTNTLTGIYSAVYKIPLVLTLFFSPISQALYPYISKKFMEGDKEGVKSVKKIFKPIMFAYAGIASVLIIFRKNIVNLVFGIEYVEYSEVVTILIIQFLFSIVNNFLGIQILVASGKQKEYSRMFSISCIIIIVLNIVLGKMYNIYGVATASLIGEIILTILLMFQCKKSLEYKEKK